MAKATPYLGIHFHDEFDIYSAAVEQQRFTLIDKHMAFVADVIGNGKIDGWNLTIDAQLLISATPGWGFIDRFSIKTFGKINKSAGINKFYYLWMRRRPGVVGDVSGFSNMVLVQYADTVAPAVPANFAFVESTFDSISLEWDEVTDDDFSYYEIYRSIDNITYTKVAQTASTSFIDTQLSENTFYYYKIRSVDLLGNASEFTSYLLCITAKDLRAPDAPNFFRLTKSRLIIHVAWLPSQTKIIDRYEIEYTPVNEFFQPIDATQTVIINTPQTDYTIRNLSENQLYKVELRSVSIHDIESESLVAYEYAGEDIGPPDVINLIAVNYESSVSEGVNGITLSWDTYEDGYESWDGTVQIIIEEYGNNYSIVANTITLDNGVNTYSFEIFTHTFNGEIVNKSVTARTTYFFTVRNVDVNGNISVGKRIYHFTPNYKNPRAPIDLDVRQQDDKSIVFSYKNSTSIFIKNIISLYRVDDEENTINILQNVDNGTQQTYTLVATEAIPNNTYYFSVYCVDDYNNVSTISSIEYLLEDVDFGVPPTQPSITVTSSNKSVYLTWTQKEIDKIEYYKIYRSTNQTSLASEDFEIVSYLPVGQYSYIDYEVEYDFFYNYYMTAVDKYGQESPNIVTDDTALISIKTVRVSKYGKLNNPTNLEISRVGTDVELTWQNSGGIFDSYEIYRSLDNKYSFDYVDNVDASTTFYLDEKALENSSAIYYLVRKVRNESELFLTESDANVTGGILLATVDTTANPAIIDNSVCRNVAVLNATLQEDMSVLIAQHKHGEDGVSKIELSDRKRISNWTTNDGQTFFTEFDISPATRDIVYLNQIRANGYGLTYEINYNLGRLTFNQQLYAIAANDTETYPFSAPPEIDVDLFGFSEVQGLLPASRLGDVDASAFTQGVFVKKQLPKLHHDGRIFEELVPKQEMLASLPGNYAYSYNVDDVTKTIGNCVTFFDIHPIYNLDGGLFASTSAGILISKDFGVTWEDGLFLNTPIIKFFYSTKYDIYLAATNTGVFYTRGVDTVVAGQENVNISLRLWVEIRGVENAKIVHDFATDADGEIYCTSELGVYKLRRPVFDSNYFFEQLTVLNANSTHAYAILYDTTLSRILISNDYGIFESYDGGNIWFFSNEFTVQKPIWSFVQKDDVIFAITDFMIWRKTIEDSFFTRVAVLEDASIMRKLQIFDNRLYVTTDLGLFVSVVDSDIYVDDTIPFEYAFPKLKTNGKDLPVTSLNVISNILYIGSENKLFISDDGANVALHYEGSGDIVPTIYVDQIPQKIGYRYYISQDILRKFVCFDDRVDDASVVTMANQYAIFVAKNGGWYFDNPESSVALHVDGFVVNKMSIAERPESSIVALLNTSNSEGAKIVKSFRKYNDGGRPIGDVLQKLYNLTNQTDAINKYDNTSSDGKFNSELGDNKLVDPIYLGGDGLGGIKGGTVEVPGYGPTSPPSPPIISGFSGVSGNGGGSTGG